MQESFLNFLWQFQYFSKIGLQTVGGQPVQVIRPGLPNTDAGPDFSNARVVINHVEWAGSVEMHLRSSDWRQHRHQENAAYENVVLHVVWQHDQAICHPDGTEIPVLCLEPFTDMKLLENYRALLENLAPVPCAPQFGMAGDIHKRQALDKALMNRLQEKSAVIGELYRKNNHDWEETTYQTLARNMGFKINAEPMLALAQSLPLKIIQKHAGSLPQIEALLFGHSGLLPANSADAYVQALQREYGFLKHKYQLESPLAAGQWKFLRLRPANFPTLRVAQLAALLHRRKNIFSSFLSLQKPEEAFSLLRTVPSEYWLEHYHFGKVSRHEGQLGRESQNNILINSIIPIMVAYAEARDEPSHIERAVSLLEAIPAENNKITRMWENIGLPIKTAFDSQASLELYHRFCTPRRCLACPVGASLLVRNRAQGEAPH